MFLLYVLNIPKFQRKIKKYGNRLTKNFIDKEKTEGRNVEINHEREEVKKEGRKERRRMVKVEVTETTTRERLMQPILCNIIDSKLGSFQPINELCLPVSSLIHLPPRIEYQFNQISGTQYENHAFGGHLILVA
jgi:hypothetical protein